MDNYITRVIWEGELLELTEHGDYENIANRHFDNTVVRYRNSDNSLGVTVQLLNNDSVEYEVHFSE